MKIRIEQGKGKKDRYAILSHHALDLLRTYYRVCKPKVWLFENRQRQTPLHPTTIGKAVEEAALEAKIKKHVTPPRLPYDTPSPPTYWKKAFVMRQKIIS